MHFNFIRRHISLALTLALLAAVLPVTTGAKDISERVAKETVLDEQISAFCRLKCIGNEREGTLRSLTLAPLGKNLYSVLGKVALRNRHVIKGPFEYVIYDHTVYVNGKGTLDSTTCDLRVEDAYVDNDYRGIFTEMLKSESDVIGRVFKVPDCRRFIE